jgi:hypothetical protein
MANNIPNKNALLHRDDARASRPGRDGVNGDARSRNRRVRRISQHRPLAMPDYHLHEVKRDGSIAKRSVVLKCRDDDEAIRQAWQLREGRRRRLSSRE